MSDKDVIKTIIIENAITTICFTLLAVVFAKWWIVLFAALFFTTMRKDGADK